MPMQQHDDAQSAHDLNAILCSASNVVHRGAHAYSTGNLSEDLIEEMVAMQVRMAQLLAYFEDGEGYGSIECEWLGAMRNYEETATGWLEAVTKMVAAMECAA